MEERIQKILSACGCGSRRTAERYIAEGRVTVNGVPAVLGDRADPEKDAVELDGRRVRLPGKKTYLMLNKPRGYVTTCADEKGRRTVAELVADCGVPVWPVGRLDLNSEGLLLMTNDGELTQRATHPSFETEKEYLVRVTGDAAAGTEALRQPMTLDGAALRPAQAELLSRGEGGTSLLRVVIHEGKNRQVRRMCEQAGLRVVRLRRVREGNLKLDPALRPGQWRPLTDEELASI